MISTWQVAKLCRDVRWDVKEFTHHLPKAFCYGGKVLRSEQVGGGVEKINIFSVMYAYIFCVSKAIISKVSP